MLQQIANRKSQMFTLAAVVAVVSFCRVWFAAPTVTPVAQRSHEVQGQFCGDSWVQDEDLSSVELVLNEQRFKRTRVSLVPCTEDVRSQRIHGLFVDIANDAKDFGDDRYGIPQAHWDRINRVPQLRGLVFGWITVHGCDKVVGVDKAVGKFEKYVRSKLLGLRINVNIAFLCYSGLEGKFTADSLSLETFDLLEAGLL